ncbi:hypothetical protein [Brevibacterium yomogidense]|uniref:hypothetical protein n=1 Tax=Brevibacterium yomogidense TaxID=946573 RepID=UPI0018DFE452|nr:hypothetical protein [Brevibacterium yomogidense]
MPTPLFARTAIAAAVTVALIGAPVAIGAPAFGATTEAAPMQPAPAASTDSTASTDPADAPSTLPAGPFSVRKATAEDTFALFDGETRFSPDDPDFDHDDIVITLPEIDGEDRDFVLVPGSALHLVTDGGHEPYAPGAHGNGDRTFAFDVAEDGTIGEVTEKSPGPGEDGDDDENGDGGSPPPSPQPTDPGPSPEPTPTGTPDPTPDPTRSPSPTPTDDPGDDGDDDGDDGDQGDSGDDDSGSDDDGSGDSGSDDDSGSGDDLTDDPSTGNGSDGSGGSSDPGPTGAQDWVPTAPRRPDYTDPVPQPPGADGDDSITPDNDGPVPQPGDDDGTDDIATDSAADDDSGAAIPWQIAVVVGIGAAAIGFILLVAGRRRAD